MLVTDPGITIFGSIIQEANASSPMDFRFFDRITATRLLQPLKAPLPMDVTASGETKSFRLLHPAKM